MDIAEEIVQELFLCVLEGKGTVTIVSYDKSYLYGAGVTNPSSTGEHQDVRNRYRMPSSHPDKDDTPDDPQEQIEYKELEAW